MLLQQAKLITDLPVFGRGCMVDERGGNVLAGELISSWGTDILLQLLQAETVAGSFEDVKMDEEAASWVWLLKLEVKFTETVSSTLSSEEKRK